MGLVALFRDCLKARRFSIQGRMRIAACVGLTGIVLIEVLSVLTLRELADVPDQLHRHALNVGGALHDAQLEITVLQTQINALADAPTRLRGRSFERRTAEATARVDQLLRSVEIGLLGGRDDLEAARRHIAEWEVARGQILELLEAGDTVGAYTVSKTSGIGAIAAAFASLVQLREQVVRDAEQLRAEASRTHESAIFRLEVMLILTAVAMFLVVHYIARKVIAPTTEISAAIGTVVEGGTDVQIPHTARLDEIGDIARSAEVFLQRAIAIRDARYDVLTGLPTREHLRERLRQLRVQPEDSVRSAALFHVDVDRLGELNDSLGRSVGDAALLRVAEIIRTKISQDDMLARESGDSFLVLVLDHDELESVEEFASQMSEALRASMRIGERTVWMTCSIGVTLCHDDASVDDLLLQAENAVIEGRKRAFGMVQIYTPEMDARLRMRRKTLLGLKEALENGEIEPFFQPQIVAHSGEVCGFEALVRWHHPELGLLSPWQFMDVAAEAGLLSAVTETMVARTTEQLATWRANGLNVPRVSLNCAASDLGRSHFADRLMLMVERAGLLPSDVCVELLETAMIEDDQNPVSRTLDRLENLGFPIELDDFGTGHAAISTLHIVKLSGLKIDRSFVTNLHLRPEQQHLTRGILRISNALNIVTVAEGVESAEELAVLVELGCNVLQGFLIAPPMSAAEATDWLRRYDPAAFLSTLNDDVGEVFINRAGSG